MVCHLYERMLLETTNQLFEFTGYDHSCSMQALPPCHRELSETLIMYTRDYLKYCLFCLEANKSKTKNDPQ